MKRIHYHSWPNRSLTYPAIVSSEPDEYQRHKGKNHFTAEEIYVLWHEEDQRWYQEPTHVIDQYGFTWVNRGWHTDDFLAFGGHESHILQIAKGLLPEGGTFLDIGAHVGLFSVHLAQKAKEVNSIEANPTTYSVLSQNVHANLPKDVHVQTFAVAAWDVTGEKLNLVEVRDQKDGGSTHCTTDEVANAGTTESARMDDYRRFMAGVDLVKIDVEGAEARVLRGMDKILKEDKPNLLIEMHDRVKAYDLPTVRAEVIEILESQNYNWNDALQNGEESYYIVARPNVPEEFVIETVRSGE